MQELKLSKDNLAEVLERSLEILRRGGVIIYPTETSYGLGADLLNKAAVEKIYQIKNRDRSKPLSVLVADFTAATSLVTFSATARRLAMENWPGPLTLVLPVSSRSYHDDIGQTLAMRVSSHPFASALAMQLGSPLVSTSANISRADSCYRPSEIRSQFARAQIKPDLFINAGDLPPVAPSTIIQCIGDDNDILRQGELEVKI